MKINAIIENKDGGTLVLDFPRSIYDVYEKLQSVGIRKSPHQIALCDEECDDVRVKLYSEDEVGKHLLLTLNEQNSLADANMLVFMVDNAKADFRSKLEQNLLHDQYSSMQEVTDDIKQMLYESGPVKAVFYCPLVGEVTDDEGFSSPVDGRFLKSYAWAVEEALKADTADDEMDMAEFFDEDDGVKAKLVSAKWGVETYRGRLFGRIECSLKEELTDAETEILTDWISGQNSDGYGEHFEQQPIDTEDGDLYVSFWNNGDNYSIMTRDELDEYIPVLSTPAPPACPSSPPICLLDPIKQLLVQSGRTADDKMRCPPTRIRLGFCRHPVGFQRRGQPQRQHKIIFRQLRFLFYLQEGYTGIKVPIVVRDLGFLHLVSILLPSANTDFVSIIISHTRHIF